MEQVRWPNTGLNLDDSIEFVSEDEWIDAENIVIGKSYKSKVGEKENVMGTKALANISTEIPVMATNSFSSWTNQGVGISWDLAGNPDVVLGSSESSKELNLVLTNPSKANYITFNYSVNTLGRASTIKCQLKNDTTVILTKTYNVIYSTGTVTFTFPDKETFNNISIFVETASGSSVENLNSLGNGGRFETPPAGWGFTLDTFEYSITNSGLYKKSGNYSAKVTSKISYSPLYGGFHVNASIPVSDIVVGKQYLARVWVYTPSSNPFASSGNILISTNGNTNSFGYFAPDVTIDSTVTKTIAEATNNWVQIEMLLTVDSWAVSDPFRVPLNFWIAISGSNTINGELYVDDFEIIEYTPNIEMELSSPQLWLFDEYTSLIDANSKPIGKVESASDNVNYVFFYNTDPDKHCILKINAKKEISLVLAWSGLNFSPLKKHRIHADITDKQIYFTDNLNEPRCVSLTKYSNGSYPTSEEEILLIKRGPTFAPIISLPSSMVLFNQLAYNYNKDYGIDEWLWFSSSVFGGVTPSGTVVNAPPVGGELQDEYQFALQYEYEDGQISVLSPWSGTHKKTGSTNEKQLVIGLSQSEQIPLNVKVVRYVARVNNSGTPFIFATVNRDRYSPLDSLRGTIYYGETYGEVVASQYNKPFENIPILAKSLCISKSRLWLGNYVEGYDTPNSVKMVVSTSNAITPNGRNLSANSLFKIGVIFSDSQGRTSSVIDNGWVAERDRTIGSNQRKVINVNLNGTIAPNWATHASIVMSNDLRKSSFVEGYANSVEYVSETGGTESTSTTYTSGVSKYIRISLNWLNSNNIFYSHKAGDKVVFTYNGNNYGPLNVVKQDGTWVYFDAVNIGTYTGLDLYYQLYTPSVSGETLYYEIAKVNISSLSVVIPVQGPDIMRSYNVNDYSIYFSQQSYSGSATVRNFDGGHGFIKTSVGQVHKKTYFKHSSPFIANTSVNGLSEFNFGDEGFCPTEADELQKLMPATKESTEGDILLALCSSDTYSVYIGESRLATNGGSFVVASPKIIGDTRKQQAGYGTLHPESVFESGGYVYWYDHMARAFCRYASNGVFAISDYKMASYFETQAVLNTVDDEVVCGYDPFYKVLFVTFLNAEKNTRKTVGFSLVLERWISFYDFAPEEYISANDTVLSIKDGVIYSHDDDTAAGFNRFYGTTFESMFKVSFNDAPESPKEWKALQIQASPNFYEFSGGNQVVIEDALTVLITNRHGQETDILSSEFEVDENMVYAEIRGDKNSEGGVLNGDPMYSNTIQCQYNFSGGTYKQILLTKAGFEMSRGHNV
jgi:hypothetical protein